jgi:hypothetical protein
MSTSEQPNSIPSEPERPNDIPDECHHRDRMF